MSHSFEFAGIVTQGKEIWVFRSGKKKTMVDSVRIQRELSHFNKDHSASKMSLVPAGDNLTHLTATIPGPISTPYEGGTFKIDITLPDGYPFVPPKMKFITKLWHPNISSVNGAICLDILKDQWSPALNLKTALLSLQALLSTPEPRDPQDAIVARQYLNEYSTFLCTARYWTETFAKVSNIGLEGKVQKLVEMGFPEDLVRKTLEAAEGDENLALEKLCSC